MSRCILPSATCLLLQGCLFIAPDQVDRLVDADSDGFVAADDCDDGDDRVNPSAVETCDSVDDDCDGLVDDDDPGLVDAPAWYADVDGDGYGDPATALARCVQPAGYVVDGTDCDDGDPEVNPGATEVCDDGVDDDCDGTPAACRISGTQVLSSADATLAGEADGDLAGNCVSPAGDVDGDGHGDLLVGAPGAGYGGTGAGAAYLVLGPVTGTVEVSAAGALLAGKAQEDYAGYAVSGAGDVDGDGYDDVVVGAFGEDSGGADAGAAYLVLGPVTGTVDLFSADATMLGEAAYDYAGSRVSSAGDVDGDGHGDLLVGAHGQDSGGTDAGAAYLLLGPVTGTVDLSSADAVLSGEAPEDHAGLRLAAAGDVDGDGHGDLLVGAHGQDSGGTDAGAAYLVLGPVTGAVSLSSADVKLPGEAPGDRAGFGVSGVGDVDGDGHDDLLIGASGNDSGGTDAGAAYLVLGPVDDTAGLAGADARLTGGAAGDQAGYSVSGAGDVDGDGRDDLLVGAYGVDSGGLDAGAAYLVLAPVSGSLDLHSGDATLLGERAGDQAGYSVSGAGDVDGDGYDDLLVGAPYARSGGAAYLLYGGGI